MPRIVHGFHITRKSRYYIPVIVLGVCVLVVALLMLGAAGRDVASTLVRSLGLSLFRLAVAYLVSLMLALLIAIPLSQSRLGDWFIPIFDLLQNLPSFALIPLFVYAFGYSNSMVVAFAASSILWPILFYVLHALKTARAELSDAATLFGARGWRRAWYYLLPLSLPAIVTGSIVGMSIGWEAVIGVEIIGLSSGVGVFLNGALAHSHTLFGIGVLALLMVVFIINRLVWMPLLRRVQLESE